MGFYHYGCCASGQFFGWMDGSQVTGHEDKALQWTWISFSCFYYGLPVFHAKITPDTNCGKAMDLVPQTGSTWDQITAKETILRRTSSHAKTGSILTLHTVKSKKVVIRIIVMCSLLQKLLLDAMLADISSVWSKSIGCNGTDVRKSTLMWIVAIIATSFPWKWPYTFPLRP